jgi:hypothetical protein
MNYLQLLERIHTARAGMDLHFGIGARQGRSLNISRAKQSIAVDPEFNLVWPILSPTRIFKMTSDAFFDKHAPEVLNLPIDLAFIDGMHLSEFALRDFMNVERFCTPDSWIVLDDVLPHSPEIASRTRRSSEWTGDIYKLTDVFRRYRPDLSVTVFDVDVKGLMLVRGVDPRNRVLWDHYDEIERDLMSVDDPVVSVAQMRDLAQPWPPESFGAAA